MFWYIADPTDNSKPARVRAKQRFNSNGTVFAYNQIIESKKAD